ncbi:MAG: hypothetical protein GY737_25700 [Desulfobacteraceae bacterium]|nr:hypothetical protein [Desulfobacteraceae bacterium]
MAGATGLLLLFSIPYPLSISRKISRAMSTKPSSGTFPGVSLGEKLTRARVRGQQILPFFIRKFAVYAAERMGVTKRELVRLSFKPATKDSKGNPLTNKNSPLRGRDKHVAVVRVTGGETMGSCKAGPLSIDAYSDGGGNKDIVHYVITWEISPRVQLAGKTLPFVTFRLMCVAIVVFIIIHTKGKTAVIVRGLHHKKAPL